MPISVSVVSFLLLTSAFVCLIGLAWNSVPIN